MLRFALVFLALLWLASCGGAPASPTYPRTVAGGYRLYRENVLTGKQIPNVIPASGFDRAVRLVYDASNGIQLTVFETKSSSVAFEAMQQWRAKDGKTATQIGRFFVIAQGEKPDPAGINAFLSDFERQLR